MSEVKTGDSVPSLLPSPPTPAALVAQIDASLKALLVLIGQSMQAKRRLSSNVRALQAKAATSPLENTEDMVLLQRYQAEMHRKIPGIKALELECLRYDALVKQLGRWISAAKDVLEQEMDKARAREEVERLAREKKEQEAEAQRLEEEQRKALKEAEEAAARKSKGEEAGAKTEAIKVDDDDDDEDIPLAGLSGSADQADKNGAAKGGEAIDLTDDSPGGEKVTLKEEGSNQEQQQQQQLPTDPAALIASMTGGATGAKDNATGDPISSSSSSMGLGNFDFSQLGLQNLDGSNAFGDANQLNSFGNDQLDFSMDFVDYSNMDNDASNMGDAGMGIDTSALFNNFDFGALLGNNGEAKKD